MKSSIRITNNGNRIHAKGAAAQALWDALTGTARPLDETPDTPDEAMKHSDELRRIEHQQHFLKP